MLEPIKFKKDFTKAENKFGKIAIKISSVNDFIPTQNAAYEENGEIAYETIADAMVNSYC